MKNSRVAVIVRPLIIAGQKLNSYHCLFYNHSSKGTARSTSNSEVSAKRFDKIISSLDEYRAYCFETIDAIDAVKAELLKED